MAERRKALVEPDILVWARTSASMTIEDAANTAKVRVEQLQAWEAGDDSPSIPQLKKLAQAYKRPMSVLFLSQRPLDFSPLKDFRLLPDIGPRTLSPKLAFEIRAAQERRQIALDIFDGLGEKPPSLGVSASLTDDADTVAANLRAKLGIAMDAQLRWRDAAKAFRAWRDAIEASGVLVFALSGAHHKIPLTEVRGFAIAEKQLPVVVVNGQDGQKGRIFTLMHELAHVTLGLSAIENSFEVGDKLPAPERAIETLCNRIAAGVLMPRDAILADPLVSSKGANASWTADEIADLATKYSVSRPAMAIRLQQVGKASARSVATLLAAYEQQRVLETDTAKKTGQVPWRTTVVTHLGRAYSRLILQGYYERKLSLNSAAAYLGTQSKHVPDIARAAFG